MIGAVGRNNSVGFNHEKHGTHEMILDAETAEIAEENKKLRVLGGKACPVLATKPRYKWCRSTGAMLRCTESKPDVFGRPKIDIVVPLPTK
jgi:hypothetical protein